MPQIDYHEPRVADEADEADDVTECEYECFDVQAWAEAYLADTVAQEEHARFPGVPFH